MEFTNAKRKLNEVSNQDDKTYNKAHKRHHSDHAPLSSINHKAAEQLVGNFTQAQSVTEALSNKLNSEAELTSRPKQPIVADETPSLSLQKARTKSAPNPKAPLEEKATKQRQASGRPSDSSADRAPVVEPSKVEVRRKIAQKQKMSRSEPSPPNKGNASLAIPTNTSTNDTSKLALFAPSSPPLEETPGEGEESEESEEEEEDDDDDDDDDGDEDDEDHLDSDLSSEISIEPASDAALDSDGEVHPDARKKETFKADNPTAFASSMAGILGYKLTRTQRANPILARSATAKEADETLLDMKLEKKAKAEMKKEKFKNGVVGSGPGHNLAGVQGRGTQEPLEGEELFANQQQEKELRKMAQKGVIKMFNAFTAVREKTMEAQGLGGSRAKKEEKATEMSKEGWLEYIGQGGKGNV